MSSYDKLIELLNADNPSAISFDSTNISFADPIPDNGGSEWNTKITVNALPNSPFVGSVDVFYRRINLSQLGTDIWLFSEEPFTIETIVSILNTTRDAFLLVTDMDSVAIPAMRVGDIKTVVLAAQSNSLGWVGENDVSLIIGFPSIVNNLSTLLNTTFPASGYLT